MSDKNRDAFRRKVRASLKKSEETFRGKYKDELKGLLGLSKEEIDAITPGKSDIEAYEKLIAVIKEASQSNVKQAHLRESIMELGEIAVGIAKKIPKLAAIL